MKAKRIILASGSKVRSQILRQCGIRHRIIISHAEEIMDQKKGPRYNAGTNAFRKAKAIASQLRSGYVIGADSLVALGKRLIGKPRSKKEALALLRSFSGKTILLYTGLCVIDVERNKIARDVAVSKIRVRKLSAEEMNDSIKKLGPFDKAGGFTIEGAGSFIFDDIEGSFYNILGLPTIMLNALFKKLGVQLLHYL